MILIEPYSCERRCTDMNVRNLVVVSGDKLHFANCLGSVLDKQSGELVWDPTSNASDSLFISCS